MNRLNRERNADIWEMLNQEGFLYLVKRRQESWKGTPEEVNIEKTTKKVFLGDIEGERPRGNPCL